MSRRYEVLLHGLPVGHLSSIEEDKVEFRWLDTYRSMAQRPVLGQKFEDDLERIHRNRKGEGLPDFFANLVPEGRLREVIEKASGIVPGDDLALLAFVGRDLPGAVEVRSVDETEWRVTEDDETSATEEEKSEAEEVLRFSLAGVQLKFSMLLEGDKLTLPGRDRSGEWIVKFDSPVYTALPQNEYSMLLWAREAGFDVPECRLRSVDDVVGLPRHHALDDTRVLMIRRYDRVEGGEKLHQEDLAQVVGLPPNKKYDQITYEMMALLIRRLIDEEAVDDLVRRLVFVIASGNNDAHLKNWSLIYPDRIRARWSPLYDQVATVAWPGPDHKLSLKLAGVKEFPRIDRRAFERFAKRALVDSRRIEDLVEETLHRIREAWRRVGGDLPLPAAHRAALTRHWAEAPLLERAGFAELD